MLLTARHVPFPGQKRENRASRDPGMRSFWLEVDTPIGFERLAIRVGG